MKKNTLPFKHMSVMIVIFLEYMFYGAYYFWGAEGRRLIHERLKNIMVVQQEVRELEKSLTTMSQKIEDWQKFPLFSERHIRELQYAQPGDEVYIYRSVN